MHKFAILFCLLLSFTMVHAEIILEKVLICGICKDIEKATPNTIASIEKLGAQFLDYQVILYENNSKDETKNLLKAWAKKNPRVLFLSENVRKKQLIQELGLKSIPRTVKLARARNIVLDLAMSRSYEDFKYVIWADLDFTEPWDVANIVDTILHPEQEWDAVLANGAYDLFALRDDQFPIGFELVGDSYWWRLSEVTDHLSLDPQGPWKPVYSAFGGLGLYKRESLKGCRYYGTVTRDLEKMMLIWLEKAKTKDNVCFLNDYQERLKTLTIINLTQKEIGNRDVLDNEIGVRLYNAHGLGKIVWLSCTRNSTLPWTCEHIPLHASMALKGHDKIFINPRLISNHPLRE